MSAFDEAWSVIKARYPRQMKLPDEDNEMHPSYDWEMYDRATSHRANRPSFQTWMSDKGKRNEPPALPAELQYQQRSRNTAQLSLVDDKGRTLSRFDIDPVDRDSWGSTELDEFVSGHYRRFVGYRKRGGVPHLARKANLDVCSSIDTPIDGIRIWILERNSSDNQ